MARAFGNLVLSQAMYIPYALYLDGQVIKVYDQVSHRIAPDNEAASSPGGTGNLRTSQRRDPRWIKVRRPFIVVGYAGLAAPPTMPSRIISRAIATSPHGPWGRTNDTLLIGGSAGEWDDKPLAPLQILPTDSGLIMYYSGSDDWHPNAFTMQLGMATSTDGGTTWQKYDDPTTTTPPYAESDPVLKPGPGSYDTLSIWGAGVIRHNNLWEMFYAGQTNPYSGPICYATSTDGGIHWTKYSGNPIFTYLNDPVSVGILELPFVAFVDSMYFLLYDYGAGQAGIGCRRMDRGK